MPVRIKGQTYYRTAEVYRLLGISRATLFRWLKERVVEEAGRRDRRGWRLFTESEVATIKSEAERIGNSARFTAKKESVSSGARHG
jgi:predicted DNA-binding transcriptional regulator AlpA